MAEQQWFEIREFPHGVISIAEEGHVENVKSYVVKGRALTMLVDTGTGFGNIKQVVDRYATSPVLLVNSHSHWDHIGDNWRFDRIWIHEAEVENLRRGVSHEYLRKWLGPENFSQPMPPELDPATFEIPPTKAERALRADDVIDLGDRQFKVIETPGHSPGGISLLEEETGILFTGDAAYAGRIFLHLDGSEPAVYRQTVQKLAELAPSISTVYPAHRQYPLEPEFFGVLRDAYEEVWSGRDYDIIDDGAQRHNFERFSFFFRPGWRD